MSRSCEICEKSYKKGNKVKRLIGNRVSRRTIKQQRANLRVKRVLVNGSPVKLKLCTGCLSRLKNINAQEMHEHGSVEQHS